MSILTRDFLDLKIIAMKGILGIITISLFPICITTNMKSCKKITLSYTTTDEVPNLTRKSAILGGNVTFKTSVVPTFTIKGVTGIATTISPSVSKLIANLGGIITYDRDSELISRGVCWDTHLNPTTANSLSTDGSGTEPFQSIFTYDGSVVGTYNLIFRTNLIS